jgi:hypothetical protein
MSRAKPWPTVANRHRVESIMKAGEVKREAQEVLKLLTQLRQAIRESNITLALAVTSAIEGQAKFMQEAAQTIVITLESAPSDGEEQPPAGPSQVQPGNGREGDEP